MTSPSLSVIILTLNEEANLPACLASLGGLPCEIFVVDSGSTDRTVEIARAAGACVFEHPFENYGAQRNWAQEHLPAGGEWLLHLDADERLTPELAAEISRTLQNLPAGVDGFLLRKRTVFMGRWIRHGGHYPSYHLRLFRRGLGCCEDRLYDQHFLVSGRVRALEHDYLDVVGAGVIAMSVRHVRWAAAQADEILRERKGERRVRRRLGGNPIERKRWWRESVYQRLPLFVRPLLYFIYRYVLRLGFLDGIEGLVFHFLQGCWFNFLVDAAVYETREAQRRPGQLDAARLACQVAEAGNDNEHPRAERFSR